MGPRAKRILVVSLAAVGGIVGAAALAWLGWAWYESRLPDTYSAMDYAIPDTGGKPLVGMAGHDHMGTSVADLDGPRGEPQRTFTLTATTARVRLASGRTVSAVTFDGTVPGPVLRMRQGDLVQVRLRNADVKGASPSTGTASTWQTARTESRA